MIDPTTDPVACYLHIQGKIEQNPDEDYPIQEMTRDLAHILLACRTFIQREQQMKAYVLEAEEIMQDTIVKSFQKDIEIHELTQKIKEIQQKEEK